MKAKLSGKHRFVLGLTAAVLGVAAGNAQTIAPTMAASAGSVNTNKPGFKMRIIQGNSQRAMNNIVSAESLFSGRAIDPTTGQVFVNNADLSTASNGVFDLPGVLNFHEQIPANPDITGGNFFKTATAPHNVADEAIPGIPGTTGNGDYFVAEYTGWLQLPAGTVRFGVNSDDGFKLTIGGGLNTAGSAVQLIVLDGTRGFGNTEANITVTQAGIYPFRLLWWENTGANSGLEFFTFAPGTTSGNRYLVNDRSQANSIKSYSEATDNPPLITFATPSSTSYVDVGGTGSPVPPRPLMYADITDGASTLNADSLVWRLNGTNLTTTLKKNGSVTTVSVQAPILPSNTTHTNTLIFADSAGKNQTNFWTFTTASYATIPPAYAVPSVDTTKPGFKARGHQIGYNKNPATGLVPNAERQIADGYLDPASGKPVENTILTAGADADGFFVEPGVLNWNQDAPANSGNFNANTGNEDKPVPGIGADSPNGTDRAVYSIETILELKAGAHRLGVNSDDGFRLSAGRGPGDVVGIQLGTAGDRGATDSFVDFVITADGFYPFRLMWWETGGGAAVEFFSVDLSTGVKTLINDTGATAIKAFRESSGSRPYISRVLPTVNYGYAFADQDLEIDITDGAISVDGASIKLTINGAASAVTSSKSGKKTSVVRKGGLSNLLASGANNVRLVYGFTEGGAAVSVTNDWSFTVPAYTRPIPVANKVSAGQVSGTGFHVRGYQIDKSKDGNQGNGGRHSGNNMPGPEIELQAGYVDPITNQPYPNLFLNGGYPPTNADGSWDIPEVLNFNNAASAGGPAANAGIFNADGQLPGHPGAGSSNFGLDNSVNEFTTYLELKAGAHIFGLNVDDGWICSSAPNAKDTLGTLLGFKNAPGGQNGSPLNNPNAAFNVIVPEDGIYPFRVLFWEGGGGVNMEFLSVDRNTGTQILVNDTAGSYPSVVAGGGNLVSPIKAYNTYNGPVKPWVKFSVYPMPYIGVTSPLVNAGAAVTLWQNRDQQSGPGPIKVKMGLLNGSWNPGEIQNASTAQRPFGDAVGAVVADLGTGTVDMVLDGVDVNPTVTDIPGSSDKLVMYVPPVPLSAASNHIAGLVYAGTTNYWIFNVITNVSVQAGTALPVAQADQNARGFRARIVQAAASQANTAVRAENQLAGNPASVAIPGPGPEGTYLIPDVINWNVTKAPGGTPTEVGNFQPLMTGTPDQAVPGIPGTGLAGALRFENVAAEIFAYLDLPAGYQKFGVNGDDGWKVQIGLPGQTNGQVLFTVDRGAGAQDIPFAFITPEAGLYPVRLVWYQGGGGGSLEFFSYGSNNQKILINDARNPEAIKAYSQLAGGERPKFTVIRAEAGGIRVEWTGGGTLETADSIDGPWTASGLNSPATIAVDRFQRYGRIKR